MDFTFSTYRLLLNALMAQGFTFQTLAEFLESPASRVMLLRHDVEARYSNALHFARIQHDMGVKGTYYFRFLPDHFDKDIIREIARLGHEIGYHYDDLSYCKGDYEKALERFKKNLQTLREIAPVKTICMEGAPLSRWDNRDLWRQGDKETRRQGEEEDQSAGGSRQSAVRPRNLEQILRASPSGQARNPKHYRDFGIIGEPYFDLDFTKVFYLTDTGRRWDGAGVSVRDKVGSRQSAVGSRQSAVGSRQSAVSSQETTGSDCHPEAERSEAEGSVYHNTSDIISAANNGLLPDRIMMTFHPQRWTDRPIPWLQELVMQNVKNVVKRLVVKRRA